MNRIPCIADDVPAIGRIALAALPHVRTVVIRVHYRTASHQFHDYRMFPPHALEELLHRAHLAMRIHVLTVGDADAYERLVFRRAHRDAPDPVALSKKMMSRKIRNVGSVLLLESLDTAQNFRIEIHQPEPEDIFLFLNGFPRAPTVLRAPVSGRWHRQASAHATSFFPHPGLARSPRGARCDC